MDNQSQTSGKRLKGKIPVPRWALALLALVILVLAAASLLKNVQFIDRDHWHCVISRTPEDATAHRKSAGPQLVGYVVLTHRYGIFRRGSVNAAEIAMTVIYENERYYAVDGHPERFLRSLLDKEQFPRLAEDPIQRYLLAATTDREAIEGAKSILKISP